MAELSHTLDEVVRREKGRVVGSLVRLLGNLDAAEEAFQDALVAALAHWPEEGTPDNPAAWLTSTAKNHARDDARHRRIAQTKAPLLVDDDTAAAPTIESVSDDELRLVFTCCHPALTLESQVALTLKVVAGFSVEEIARALLSPEKTVAQRIARAKRTIEDEQLPYEVPGRAELPERLDAVLTVVYLLFNEGHTARQGALVRLDLQREALRLARELCDLLPTEAEVFGLYAVIAFAIARAATRTDDAGAMLTLAARDRSRWDRRLTKEGLFALEHARRLQAEGASPSRYSLEAEIAACHATAPTWESTEWARILAFYDALAARGPSPIVELNRAVAVCMHSGPAAALGQLAPLEEPLRRYHYFYAVRADVKRRLGEDARADYSRAIELATNENEQTFLRRQLAKSTTPM